MDTLQSLFDLTGDAHNSAGVSGGFHRFVFMSDGARLALRQRQVVHRRLEPHSLNDGVGE